MSKLVIPDGVTEIGSNAFYNCNGLKELILPDSLSYIGLCIFGNCSSLTEIIIPESVTFIGDIAFSGCTDLTAVVIPYSVTYIDDNTFLNCPSLTILCFEDSYAMDYAIEHGIPYVLLADFSDVPDDAWYAPYVYDLADQGILNGKGNGIFDPNGSITRGEFAKILAAASGEDLSSCNGRDIFCDVRPSDWFSPYVSWAYDKGIVFGVSEKEFAPNEKITREQMAAMICRYAKYQNVPLTEINALVVFKDDAVINDWAKENVKSCSLEDKCIRFLIDDCVKFVKREIRRGNKYDIILMDPPSFGRGSKSEVWNIEDSLFELVSLCTELLSDDPLLFIINSYTTGLSKTVLENILYMTLNQKINGLVSSDELGIRMKNSDLVLPCGIYARWEKMEK